MKKLLMVLSIIVTLALLVMPAFPKDKDSDDGKNQNIQTSRGQTLYVPAIYVDFSYQGVLAQIGNSRLIIRNIDPETPITVLLADFYSPAGDLVHSYIEEPVTVEPFASITYAATPSALNNLALYDKDGGRPFFLVKWESNDKVCPPIIESARVFMVKIQNTPDGPVGWRFQGLNLTPGTVIREK